MMMGTILKATGLSSPVRRDYSIAGSKFNLVHRADRTYLDQIGALQRMQLIGGPHGYISRQICHERSWEQVLREFSPRASSFIGLIECLIQSDQQIRLVFSLPGPITNQTTLSRILAFSESESGRIGYICSPSKKRKVRALLATIKEPDELSRIAEIIACQDNDLIEMMDQN
jgi:hypothetical protein